MSEQFSNSAITTMLKACGISDGAIQVGSIDPPMPPRPEFRILVGDEIMRVNDINPGAPQTAPTLTGVSGSTSFHSGSFELGYTYAGPTGIESQIGPTATVTISAGQKIRVSAITGIPNWVDSLKFYIQSAPVNDDTGFSSSVTTSTVTSEGTPYRNVILADGPVSYWRLNDSNTTAVDQIGVEDGTLHGGVTTGSVGATLDNDSSMTFNGSTGRIDVPDNADYHLRKFSIEAWIYKTADSDFQRILTCGPNPNAAYYLEADDSNKIQTGFFDVSGTEWKVTSSATVGLNGWHHIVTTYDAVKLRLYIDGSLSNSTSTTNTPRIETGGIGIGSDNGGGSYWHGRLDEVALYSYPLTSTQISNHYNQAADSTGSTAQFDITAEGNGQDAPTSNPTAVYSVDRAQEGTAAAAHSAGTPVIHIVTADALDMAFMRTDNSNVTSLTLDSLDLTTSLSASTVTGSASVVSDKYVEAGPSNTDLDGSMRIVGSVANSTPTDAKSNSAGDLAVDSTNGMIYVYGASQWFPNGLPLIASKTLTSAATAVSFTSIPQNYSHLLLLISANSDATTALVNGFTQCYIQFNGKTNDNYINYGAIGAASNGGNVTTSLSSNDVKGQVGTIPGFAASQTHSNVSANYWYFNNYTDTVKEKIVLGWEVSHSFDGVNSNEHFQIGGCHFYPGTSNPYAITSVKIFAGSGNLYTGSTFRLYGIY